MTRFTPSDYLAHADVEERTYGQTTLRQMLRQAAKDAAEVERLRDVRQWFFYPIEMPVTADNRGPAAVGVDAAAMTYEVWDVLLNSHASFDKLPDAINEAMRLNILQGDPS